MPVGIGGLSQESILMCEQIRVIDKRRLVHKIGNVGEEHLGEVEEAIKVILGLE
jgi:mRNA interferase MazF